MQKENRLKRELAQLMNNPIDGICCYPRGDNTDVLLATIIGPQGSPYQDAAFDLEVIIPKRYPFEPPRITFLSPVYHPNIDNSGRICMDLLKMPPLGGWKPTLNLKNLLEAIQFLLGNPNVDDPLVAEIAQEYRLNKSEFERKAQRLVQKLKNQKKPDK